MAASQYRPLVNCGDLLATAGPPFHRRSQPPDSDLPSVARFHGPSSRLHHHTAIGMAPASLRGPHLLQPLSLAADILCARESSRPWRLAFAPPSLLGSCVRLRHPVLPLH